MVPLSLAPSYFETVPAANDGMLQMPPASQQRLSSLPARYWATVTVTVVVTVLVNEIEPLSLMVVKKVMQALQSIANNVTLVT